MEATLGMSETLGELKFVPRRSELMGYVGGGSCSYQCSVGFHVHGGLCATVSMWDLSSVSYENWACEV